MFGSDREGGFGFGMLDIFSNLKMIAMSGALIAVIGVFTSCQHQQRKAAANAAELAQVRSALAGYKEQQENIAANREVVAELEQQFTDIATDVAQDRAVTEAQISVLRRDQAEEISVCPASCTLPEELLELIQ